MTTHTGKLMSSARTSTTVRLYEPDITKKPDAHTQLELVRTLDKMFGVLQMHKAVKCQHPVTNVKLTKCMDSIQELNEWINSSYDFEEMLEESFEGEVVFDAGC